MSTEIIHSVKFIGHHHHQCVEVLREHFKGKKIEGIEIGTNAGDLTVTLLRDLSNLSFLDTIDPWKYFEGQQFEAGNQQDYHNRQMEAAFKRLEQYRQRVKMHRMTSDKFFKLFPNIEVDFVWIDGHHEYGQVKKDIQNAKNVVKDGGIVGGHDYGLVADVKKAVHEEFNENEVFKGGDFTWWIYK